MGLGEMGAYAAQKLVALGFQVSGWSNTRKSIVGVTSYAGADERDAFLAQTDILVSLLPHTPATHHLIDKALIGKLARDGALGGPILVNAGRGKTQVDGDVLAALRDGRLKAASLDVFETEPLPKNSVFWSLPNLIVTPHAAAWSDRGDVVAHMARQVRRLRDGLAFEHVVDRARGY